MSTRFLLCSHSSATYCFLTSSFFKKNPKTLFLFKIFRNSLWKCPSCKEDWPMQNLFGCETGHKLEVLLPWRLRGLQDIWFCFAFRFKTLHLLSAEATFLPLPPLLTAWVNSFVVTNRKMKMPKGRSGDPAGDEAWNESGLFLFLAEESAQEGLEEEGAGILEE